MKIGIVYRICDDPYRKRTRLYIPSEFKEIFDELNITLIPIVTDVGLKDMVSLCDGLIVPGSFADTNPKYYNELPLEGKEYDVDEFAYDSKVIKMFHELNKPILGICGGHQEINVLFGGTLFQKIDNHSNVNHKIKVSKDSFLYSVYNKEEVEVNSYHHQAINKVAEGFKVSAISSDGTIEAIEKDNIVCVQYHPEMLKELNFFSKWTNKYL